MPENKPWSKQQVPDYVSLGCWGEVPWYNKDIDTLALPEKMSEFQGGINGSDIVFECYKIVEERNKELNDDKKLVYFGLKVSRLPLAICG